MDYLADTANIDEIRDLFHYFPMEGVTTNPTILSHENKPLSKIVPEIQECIGDKMLGYCKSIPAARFTMQGAGSKL